MAADPPRGAVADGMPTNCASFSAAELRVLGARGRDRLLRRLRDALLRARLPGRSPSAMLAPPMSAERRFTPRMSPP